MNPYLLINIIQKYWLTIPTDDNSVTEVIDKLSHRSQVACALEAAKMVLPTWEYVSKNLTKEQREAPKKAIEIVEKWLKRKATVKEVNKIAGYLDAIAHDARATTTVRLAATVVASATVSVSVNAVSVNASKSISLAAYVIGHSDAERLQFYRDWWNKCQSLVEKELQNKYELLIKNINGDV